MKTKISICIIMSAFLLVSCGRKKSPQTEKNRVYFGIIQNTKEALKNLSIEKILLDGRGYWSDGITESYLFKKNGTVEYRMKMDRLKDFYWKVIDGKLYINPNNSFRVNKNEFILITKIVAEAPSGYGSLSQLKNIKYSISFEDKSGKLWIYAHNFKKSSLPY